MAELNLPNINPGIIQEGTYALISKVSGDVIRTIKIMTNQTIQIERLRVQANDLVGAPYGLFSINTGNAAPISVAQLQREGESINLDIQFAEPEPSVDSAPIAPSSDQLALNEAQARQRYTEEEISEMKMAGTSSTDLVNKLIEGSSTFQNRTEHAKGKYIEKKRKKHSDRILVLRPTVRLLCESYYKKDPERVANLRWDQLGHVLQLAGIHAGKRVALFDQVCGIGTTAILERLGGRGSLVHLHRGMQAQGMPCVQAMNFSEQSMLTLQTLRIDTLLNDGVPSEERYVRDQPPREPEEELSEEKQALNVISAERRAERAAAQKLAWQILQNGVDSIIIFTKTLDPINALEYLYGYLRPAGTIVVYGPVLQPIIATHNWLRTKNAVNVQMQDQMYRMHQVLPQRTHPLMSQMVLGGFIVSAIKVIYDEHHLKS
ncbi:unnamed protein product, partial [Mesorhabditis spiculigera]